MKSFFANTSTDQQRAARETGGTLRARPVESRIACRAAPRPITIAGHSGSAPIAVGPQLITAQTIARAAAATGLAAIAGAAAAGRSGV